MLLVAVAAGFNSAAGSQHRVVTLSVVEADLASLSRLSSLDGGLTRVADEGCSNCFGAFASIPDALLAHEYLRSAFGIKSDLKVIEAGSNGPIADVERFIPRFFTAVDAKSSDLPVQSLRGSAAKELLDGVSRGGTKEEYRAALKAAIPDLAADDPLRGYIELNLGMLDLEAGEFTSALAHLIPLAEGRVLAAANHRLMAMWRTAWIYHQKGDRLKAYRIYQEFSDFGEDPWVAARASVEKAGLLLEFSKDERYGHYDLVRRGIDSLLESFPAGYREQRCTIELIRLESYYYEGKYADCVAAATEFIGRYNGLEPKQEIMAALFAGISEHMLGNYEAARTRLEATLDRELAPTERWQSIPDPHLHTLRWLRRISTEHGDLERVAEYERRIDGLENTP